MSTQGNTKSALKESNSALERKIASTYQRAAGQENAHHAVSEPDPEVMCIGINLQV